MLFGLSFAAFADEAVLLETAEQSAQARVELARNGDELYVGTYILGQDAAGLQMMAALRAAARRGVKVQIIADAYENQLSKGILKELMEDPASVAPGGSTVSRTSASQKRATGSLITSVRARSKTYFEPS